MTPFNVHRFSSFYYVTDINNDTPTICFIPITFSGYRRKACLLSKQYRFQYEINKITNHINVTVTIENIVLISRNNYYCTLNI